MKINEFKNGINLILNFTSRMDEESVPPNIQRIFVKVYATTLKINLTDKMINDIIQCYLMKVCCNPFTSKV